MLATTAAVLTGAYLGVWALEHIPGLRFRKAPWLRRYVPTDLAWYLVALAAVAVTGILLRPQLQRLRVGPVASAFDPLPGYIKLAVAVVAYDLVAFSVHVAVHHSDTLWKVHKVHHYPRALDGLATTRTHMMELLLRNIPAQLVLSRSVQISRLVATTVLIYALFALLGHSNLNPPTRRLEWLFITPRLHRLHHIPATTQHNFGTIFSVWDRSFGLLSRRDASVDEPTGVPGEITTYPQRFVAELRAPFREMRDAKRSHARPHGVGSPGPARVAHLKSYSGIKAECPLGSGPSVMSTRRRRRETITLH